MKMNKASEKTTMVWVPQKELKNVRVHQASGFCLTKDNKFILVRDWDEERFTLPGGGVDKGETSKQSFERETLEEAQVTLKDVKLLGVIEVRTLDKDDKIIDHHQQARFIAKANNMREFIPRLNGWETEERIEVELGELPKYLKWLATETGKQIFNTLTLHLKQ